MINIELTQIPINWCCCWETPACIVWKPWKDTDYKAVLFTLEDWSGVWVISIVSWGTTFLPAYCISNTDWLGLKPVCISSLYLGNSSQWRFLLRLKAELIAQKKLNLAHSDLGNVKETTTRKFRNTDSILILTCIVVVLRTCPSFLLTHIHRHRQTDKHVYIHSPKKTTQWNLALSNCNLNIASGLLIDLHALAHKNMLFSLPLLALSNSFGFFRCQCVMLLVNPNLNMPK